MSHTLIDFQVHEIGERAGMPDLQWARMTMRMKNALTGQIEEVSAHITLPRGDQMTVGALVQLAQRSAAQLLKQAVDVLQGPEGPT